MSDTPNMENNRSRALRDGIVAAALLLLIASIWIGLAAGGEFGQFMLAGAQTIPFVVLAMLSYLGLKRWWAKGGAILWMLILISAYALFNLALGYLYTLVPGESPNPVPLLQIAGGITVAGLISLLGFIPAFRRLLSRFIPLDPDSFVHAVALVTVVAFTLIGFVPLLVLGEPALLAPALTDLIETGAAEGTESMQRYEAYALLWTILGSVFVVGYGLRRSFRGALDRLGIERPTWKQGVGGVLLGAGLILAIQYFGLAIQWVWEGMGWPQTDEEALLGLFSHALTPLGALVTALYAGVGEELAVRGALQPRLGILLPTLFFASLHAAQYNWDSVLVVFLLGLVMAFVRQRTNTTTSIIVHTVYDLGLFMLLIFEGGF